MISSAYKEKNKCIKIKGILKSREVEKPYRKIRYTKQIVKLREKHIL